ncbi:hypothetical protein Tco_0444856 [Tanacetum coccineum]
MSELEHLVFVGFDFTIFLGYWLGVTNIGWNYEALLVVLTAKLALVQDTHQLKDATKEGSDDFGSNIVPTVLERTPTPVEDVVIGMR